MRGDRDYIPLVKELRSDPHLNPAREILADILLNHSDRQRRLIGHWLAAEIGYSKDPTTKRWGWVLHTYNALVAEAILSRPICKLFMAKSGFYIKEEGGALCRKTTSK